MLIPGEVNITTSNSPANDSWTFTVGYTGENETEPNLLSISYLPTGEIDLVNTPSSDLQKAKTLLAPTAQYLAAANNLPSFDVFKFINWLWVSDYWLSLLEFGQLAPASYHLMPQGQVNFSSPITYAPTNNIFVNNTLFHTYSSYLLKAIIPSLCHQQMCPQGVPFLEFLAIDEQNRLQLPPAIIFKSYSCVERRLRGPFSLIVSVLAANYALIGGAYQIFIFVAGWFQQRKDAGKSIFQRD
jgi:hypothetical protein